MTLNWAEDTILALIGEYGESVSWIHHPSMKRDYSTGKLTTDPVTYTLSALILPEELTREFNESQIPRIAAGIFTLGSIGLVCLKRDVPKYGDMDEVIFRDITYEVKEVLDSPLEFIGANLSRVK